MRTLFRILCLALLILPGTRALAQRADYSREDFADAITVQNLQLYLSVLASEALEGRETGTPGNDEAARFIAGQLHAFGIRPHREDGSYFQEVTFTRTDWGEVSLQVDTQQFRHMWDFICLKGLRARTDRTVGQELVFLGYGIDDPRYSDYTVDVSGKAILIYDGEPKDKKGRYRLTGTTEPGEWSRDWQRKVKAARDRGASAVFLISSDFQRMASQVRRFSVGPSISLGEPEAGQWPALAVVSAPVAKALMGAAYDAIIKTRDRVNKGKRPEAVRIQVPWTLIAERKDQITKGYNVLGYIEGSDPVKKEELVVLTAHFDHLGRRGDDIFYGADDNGSGTATLLDVARSFALARQKGMGPARSLLFLWVTGEEKGLLGSKYYVENPVFPLEQSTVNINVDMVGRVDKKYKDNPHYIYVIGSDKLSTDLHAINEEVNSRYVNLALDYTYNDEKDPNRYYYRSDHYNFAERGIPAIFFFSGTHEDYHRPSDTVDKINFERMAGVARHVFHLTWELANRKDRIRVDVPQNN